MIAHVFVRLLCIIGSSQLWPRVHSYRYNSKINLTMSKSMTNNGTFLYFAYGSNLLAARLHIANPSAQFFDIGLLKNYRLDFVGYSKTWGGSPATIVPSTNSYVWGAIWTMSNEHLKTLDSQEGVDIGVYFALDVDVVNKNGTVYRCRVYRQTKEIDDPVPLSQLSENRRPSLIYLKTIIKGAQDCDLPKDYINNLKIIKHNGKHAFNNVTQKTELEVCDVTRN